MCTAEIGRAGQATDPDAWEGVADTWERLPHPYPAAYARMRQAEALPDPTARSTSRGRRAAARRRHGRALGAGPLLEDIAALAGRARITLEMPALPCAAPPPWRARRAHRP